ncbi:alpha-L-fucosidase [Streptomyces sp. NPDC058240]|uniref:alpha-L-fucosidase n=1 Tax=Streptomyces sp. NPDC058240 TaxID=3346396 RepID=UPI0036E30DFE
MVGEFAEAVRAEGLRFGVHCSGGLDRTFDDRPIGTGADTVSAVPRGSYPAYAGTQMRELIRRYRPDILWNDIAWPGSRADVQRLIEYYRFAVPHGVVNDRLLAYLGREALETLVRETAAGGGNLLLNVGPRGEDATIPAEQQLRLEWLAELAPGLAGERSA